MKRMMFAALAGAAVMTAVPALAQSATFEDNTLDGFTAVGEAGTDSLQGEYTAAQGNLFAYLYAGRGEDVYSTLTRTFTLRAGQTLSGQVGFQALDYLPYNDDAYLSVNGSNIFTSNVAMVGDNGKSGWQGFTFTAPTAGAYSLQLGVRNVADNGLASLAVLDGIGVAGGVPEASTWAMMIVGFGAVGGVMRRRQKTAVRFATA